MLRTFSRRRRPLLAVGVSLLALVIVGAGGDDPDAILPLRALNWIGFVGYPAARVDHRLKDGDTIRVGPIVLSAHITAGHTRGCTSWSFPVIDGDRVLNVVSACDPSVLGMLRYPEQDADRAQSARAPKPPGRYLGDEPREAVGKVPQVRRKQGRQESRGRIHRSEGYRAFVDAAEAELRSGKVH